MNYSIKDKKNSNSSSNSFGSRSSRSSNSSSNLSKRRINWNQSLKTIRSSKGNKPKRLKKSLQYLLVLKKFNNLIDYKNIKLLRAFLTKYGKIRARRKTRISVQKQHAIAKAIRKARALKLIPFTIDVKI